MKTLSLCRFRLTGAWSPLLSNLPHWRQSENEIWTDDVSTIELSKTLTQQAAFGFKTDDKQQWIRIAGMANSQKIELTSPSGVLVSFEFLQKFSPFLTAMPTLIMNHVAINVTCLNAEQQWYETLLGPSTVLSRNHVWEPVSRRYIHDAHLFRSPHFYIALREAKKVSKLDHVGWMCNSKQRVNEIYHIVKKISWPVIFGPEELDQSYLFHFEGPDGRIHDFFFPTDALPSVNFRKTHN
jgi:hypothetical protein